MTEQEDAEAERDPWEKAADEVLDECADKLGYSGMTGARMAVEKMRDRWEMVQDE